MARKSVLNLLSYFKKCNNAYKKICSVYKFLRQTVLCRYVAGIQYNILCKMNIPEHFLILLRKHISINLSSHIMIIIIPAALPYV